MNTQQFWFKLKKQNYSFPGHFKTFAVSFIYLRKTIILRIMCALHNICPPNSLYHRMQWNHRLNQHTQAKELSTLHVGSSISIKLHSAAEIRTQGNYYSELSIKDES